MSTTITKHRFYQTECLLYAYRGAIEVIKEQEEYIAFLDKYGLPRVSKSLVGAAKIDIFKDILQEKIDALRESIEFLRGSIRLIDMALSSIRQDKFYNVIEMKYFEGMSMEDIAEHCYVSVSTVYRQRERLVDALAGVIFAGDVFNTVLGEMEMGC